MPMTPSHDDRFPSPLHGLVLPPRALELVCSAVLFLFGLQFVLLDDRLDRSPVFRALLDNTPILWVEVATLVAAITLLLPRIVARGQGRATLGYAILREGVPCAAGAILIWLGAGIGVGQLLNGGFGSALGYVLLGIGLLYQTIQRAGE